MATFQRKIELRHLDSLGQPGLHWLDDLFRFWAPAGSPARHGTPAPLRLAIRKNYVNFYVFGQSVGKVRMGPRVLNSSVHLKYLEQNPARRKQLGQRMATFDAARPPALGQGRLADWMKIAAEYANKEKCFVERLLAANPDVVDVEMGLPSHAGAERNVADRIDLVALEPTGGGWQIAFWEAKMAGNKEARARGEALPKVIAQQQRYVDWLDARGGENRAAVIDAYAEVCRILVDIHERVSATALGEGLGDLGRGIREVAAGAPLSLDRRIRLIFDNSIGNDAFEANGHRKRLEDLGLLVQVVPAAGDHRLWAAL